MSEQESSYVKAVTSGLEGMKGVSTGECPGCEHCAESHDMTSEEHSKAWRNGTVDVEVCFSWSPCGICKSHLGGDRHVWHWISGGDEHGKGGEIQHESDACTDCVYFLAYGTEPED